jgi:O-antigen/teichoic acid export membrane protein
VTGLKEKSISGVKWSALGQFVGLGSEFIIGIILARLLIPSEFGVVAVLSVFINLANVFINSGFSQSLIRDQNANQVDYSTIFYFNLFVSYFLIVKVKNY